MYLNTMKVKLLTTYGRMNIHLLLTNKQTLMFNNIIGVLKEYDLKRKHRSQQLSLPASYIISNVMSEELKNVQ